jgi:hypothetical protein
MKGLNIKKIAALGLGAALVGSALAPAVMAAGAYSNLDKLKKADVIGTDGTPVVNIVVGSLGKAPDVVWAGNIAAKVAQMAAVPLSGGTATGKTVDLSVGGTTVVSGGARDLTTNALNSVVGSTPEYAESVGNTYFKSFVNGTKNATRDGNTTFSLNVAETVTAQLDARMNITAQAVKDLAAEIDPNDVNYNLAVTNLNMGTLPFSDSGTDDYVPISFLGKNYVIDSMSSSSVVLVSDNAEKIYNVDDVITGVKGRDGKDYQIKFTAGLYTGSAYIARVALLDAAGAKLDEQTFNANSDIVFRNTSGQELLATKVRLKSVLTNGSSSSITYSFSALVGTDRMEIQSGREVPYDPNGTGANMPWVATVTGTSSALTVTLKNNNYYMNGDTPLYSTEYSFNPTGKKTAFNLFEGTGLASIGKIVFKGFYDTGVQKTTVKFKKGQNAASGTTATSYGAVEYVDVSGQQHSIPMAIYLNSTSATGSGSTFKFESIDHAYSTDSASDPTLMYVASSTTDVNLLAASSKTLVLINTTDVNHFQDVTLTGKNSQTYTYMAKEGVNHGVWLVLAGYDANRGTTAGHTGEIGTDTQYSAGSVFLLGTALNDANISTVLADYGRDWNVVPPTITYSIDKRPYYYPDTYDFTGAQSGSSTGVYRTAIFQVNETAGNAVVADDTDGSAWAYVDTEGGNSGTVDTANIAKINYAGKTTAAVYYGSDQNLTTFSEYLGNPGESSANYKKAYTVKGTKIVLDSRELAITLPDQAMKAFFSIQSNDVTTTNTGGTNFTGLVAGTPQTVDGVTVTVSAVSGGASTGYDIKKVGNIVALDKDSTYGKSILVGGWLVNSKVAKEMKVDGTSLEERIVSAGDYVAAIQDGSIIVAGWLAEDTGSAAQALIAALDKL